MAALYGRLQGNRGEATRMGTKDSGIYAKLETWDGSIKVHLEANGDYFVYIGEKYNPRKMVASGNVDNKKERE